MLRPKTLPAYELLVQAWWDDTLIYSNHFFDMTATLKFDALETDVVILYHELDMIRLSYEEADYPVIAAAARQHLLKSMAKVIYGFQQFIAGNVEAAQQHMDKAQLELRRMENELTRLGLPIWCKLPRLH